jgi:hypothetical protein
VELFLTNGHKIVVIVARVKFYFGAISFADDIGSSIVPTSSMPIDNNLPNDKNLLANGFQSFNLRALSPAHARTPG